MYIFLPHPVWSLFWLNRPFLRFWGQIILKYFVPYPYQKFLPFLVKFSHCIWVHSQLTGWIFISHIINCNSQNLAHFLRPMRYESQRSPNSYYLKIALKECTVFWIGVYLKFFRTHRRFSGNAYTPWGVFFVYCWD